jgi:hypothetical protein
MLALILLEIDLNADQNLLGEAGSGHALRSTLHKLRPPRYTSTHSGPYFNEVTLAQFALDLDKKERELMLEQGMTKDFLNYMKEESGNVAMDGNYSVQVLQCKQ